MKEIELKISPFTSYYFLILKKQAFSMIISLFNLNNARVLIPGAPLTYSNDGEGGGECPSDFFGSEILANNDFFGSMKDAGIFLGCKKKIRGVFFEL